MHRRVAREQRGNTRRIGLDRAKAQRGLLGKDLGVEEISYLTLHHQTLAYAMKDGWNIATSPQDRIDMRGVE